MPAPHVLYSLAFFVLIMILIMVVRPPLVFEPVTRLPRPFGAGPGRTMFSLGVVTVVTAVLCMYLFAMIEIMTIP